VPDPLSIIRLAALLVFIALVAVGLWLLDVAWWVVPPVMALALFIAWTVEWLAWRGTLTSPVVHETAASPSPATAPPVSDEAPLPAEAIVPVPPPAHATVTAPPPAREPEPPAAVQEPPRPEPESEHPPAEPEREPGPPPSDLEPPPAPPTPRPTPPAPEPPPPPPVAEAPPEPKSVPAQAAVRSPEPERRLRRPRRMRLRPVPPPAPSAETPPQPAESPVVALRPRAPSTPRSWNLWDLERLAREGARVQPERREEWGYLFLHLRQFAAADGSLPAEFDTLVRESFGGLLERPGS
jgi:hypothetical protein